MNFICNNCGTECSPPGENLGKPILAKDGQPMCSTQCLREYEGEHIE